MLKYEDNKTLLLICSVFCRRPQRRSGDPWRERSVSVECIDPGLCHSCRETFSVSWCLKENLVMTEWRDTKETQAQPESKVTES